jgi:hypothetical protein
MRLFIVAVIAFAAALTAVACNSSSTTIPSGLAFNHFYVANDNYTPAPQVWQFALPLTNTSSPTLTMPGNGMNRPKALAFDRNGNLFAVNNPGAGNVFITVYAPGVAAGSSPIATLMTGFPSSAYTIGIDPSGLVWTCQVNPNPNWHCFQYPGPYVGNISPSPTITLSAGLSRPEGLAWNAAGDLFVANEGIGGGVVRFNHPITDGEGNSGILSTGGDFVIGAAFDSAGNLYTGNNSNGNILRWNANNQGDGATPDFRDTATGSSSIYNVSIDAAGNLYAADLGNCKILVFANVATSFSNSLAPTVVMPLPSGCSEGGAVGP